MSTAIGLFRAHAASIDRLVQTTVGRAEMLEDLLEKLQRNAGKKGGQHYLFIGPRGSGKTHFLSLVEKAAETSDTLRSQYTVIRFPEENNRILCFADILLEIVQNLGEVEEAGTWRQIYASLASVDNDQDIIDAVIPRLRQYRKQNKKTLLLLMENLNTLFCEQIKNEQDIHRFRTFLMDSPCATLIGTSPVLFSDLTSVRKPFFEFFDIQVLEDLSEELTLDLIKKNLELDKRQDLLDRLDQLAPKIRALHTMTGGNPRLVMMLYELIAYDNILEVQAQFQKLLDQITPFYQDRMKELAPQERALLENMALMRTEPRTPVAIAARMRKSPQQTSSLLKRMIGSGHLTVSVNPQDKRSRLYRIKEGFFDLWLAMSGSRTVRTRLDYLVKLFEVWYHDRMERDKKRLELRQTLQKDQIAAGARENHLTYLDYLSEIGDCDERCEAKLMLSLDYLKAGKALRVRDLLSEVKPLAPTRGVFSWMTEQVWQRADDGTGLDMGKWIDGLIEYWKIQRSGDLEKTVAIAQRVGIDLSDQGLHWIRIELLQDALACAHLPADRITLNLQIADSQKIDGQLDNALQSLKTALKICQEISDKAGEGTTLNNISQIYYAHGDYDMALKYLEQALTIQIEIGDKSGEGTTLNNISQIYKVRGTYDTALKYLQRSLAICQEIGDKSGEGITLNNISTIFYAYGDYDSALNYLEKSLIIRKEIGDESGESTTLNNISQIYFSRGDLDVSLKYIEQSLPMCQKIGDKSGEGTTLNNISQIYFSRGDFDVSLKYLEQALKIYQEIGDKSGEGTTLNNISKIYHAHGDYDMALRYLEQALSIKRKIGDKSGEGTTLNNISQIYDVRGDYDMALRYLEQALNIYQEIGNKSGEGTTLNNISQIHDARGDYDKALKYLEQALTIHKRIGNKFGEGITLNNISNIFYTRGDFDTALKYLQQALDIKQQIGDRAGLCATLFNIGNIHFRKEEIPKALKALVTVYRLARSMNIAEALGALENLAKQMKLDGGLDGWERLSEQIR